MSKKGGIMEKKGLKVAVFFSLVIMLCLLVAGLYTTLKIVPEYTNSYQLMNQGLPFLTRLCIKISMIVSKGTIIVVPVLLLVILGAVIMWIVGKNKILALNINTSISILAALFIIFCYYATRLPVMRMEKESQRQFAAEGYKMVPAEPAK